MNTVNRQIILLLNVFLLFVSNNARSAQQICDKTPDARPVVVLQVFDGDTVAVRFSASGPTFRVRLAGINAPELGDTPQPFARQAKQQLQRLVNKKNLYLVPVTSAANRTRVDRYNRILAHLFTGNINIQQHLLKKGLAFNIVYPPGLRFQSCYKIAQSKARLAGTGIWKSSYFAPLNASRLAPDVQPGFKLVSGKVRNIYFGKNSVWINFFSYQFSVRIARSYRHYFTRYNLMKLKNRQLTVSGYLIKKYNRNTWFINIKHPDALW